MSTGHFFVFLQLHLFLFSDLHLRFPLPRMNDRLLFLSSGFLLLLLLFLRCWPRLHDYALAFLGPGIVLLVGRVYQRVILLILFHVLSHCRDALRQGPPFHGRLVLHVLDLLLQCVLVHGGEYTGIHDYSRTPLVAIGDRVARAPPRENQ